MRPRRMMQYYIALVTILYSELDSAAQICGITQIPANLRDGLLAYYPFCGNANDVSGNGNNGIVSGATLTTDRFGISNNAYYFDGLENKIQVLSNNLSVANTNNLTISAWINSSSTSTGQGRKFVTYTTAQGQNNQQYALSINNSNQLYFLAGSGSFESHGLNLSPPIITAGQWHLTQITYDGNYIKMYVDGEIVLTKLESGTFNAGIVGQLILGNHYSQANTNLPFWGKIDDVAIWNRALTSCEITQIYSATTNAFPQIGIPNFNPFQDTTRVCGVSTSLNAGAGFTTYNWSTGATTQSVDVSSNKKLTITVTDPAGCTANDSTVLILKGKLIQEENSTACTFSNYQLTAKRSRGPLKYLGSYLGHDYFIDTISRKWTSSRDTSKINDSQLWVINNLAENTYVYNNLLPFNSNNNASYWAGLYQDINATNFNEPSGGWKWVDGSDLSFSNWREGEPNNQWLQGVAENFMNIKWSNQYQDKWNDIIEDLNNLGYETYGISESVTPTYLWSTGETSNSIAVSSTQTTTYYLTVTDQFLGCTDSVTLTANGFGVFNPFSDTTRTCGISAILDAGAGLTSYSWNTGANTQAISPSLSGFYKVIVSNANGCIVEDSTFLSLVRANIINNDTTICKGSMVTLRIDSTYSGITSCQSIYLPPNLQSGLVAYYPFCENANDESGNVNNGTVHGATLVADRFGMDRRAYHFNGNGQYISAAVSNLPNSARTTSLWLKTPIPSYSGMLLAYGGNGACGTSYFLATNHRGTGKLMVSGHCQANETSIAFFPPASEWVHLVTTSSSTGTKIYINGLLVTTSDKQFSTVGSSLFLGSSITFDGSSVYIDGSGGYWLGDMDDVMIYNRELSNYEIQQLFSSQQAVSWSTGANTNQIFVTPFQSTTYFASITNGISNCTDSVRITVSELDTAVVVLDPEQVCTNGGQVRMQAGLASGYQWLRNGVALVGATSRLYTATQTGAYRVALVNSAGCRDTSRTISVSLYPQPISGFNITPNTQCFEGNQFSFTNTTTLGFGTINYLWNFGNGITSTQTNPFYSYPATGTYIVKLVATTGTGCKDSTIRTITVNPSPTATFSVNTASQCVSGNQFSFTNNSSITTGTLTYAWTFGDGNVSANANPSHSYINAGTYTVKLVVTSALGCKDSTTRSINVYAKPTVDFSVNSLTQCVNENSFVFSNNTTITSGTITYVWRFGDGNTATSANATHSYLTAGTYIVKLIAVTNNGCSDSTTQAVTVNPKPTVDFSIDNAAQCLSANQFVFNNLSAIASGILTHAWNFGNGATSIQTSPTYTYGASGVYFVKLLTTSAAGCRDSITRSITVHAMPTGALNTPVTNLLCEGGTVSLSASGGTSYQWFINGGAIVGATSATYAANLPGTYSVNVVSSNGCVSAATGTITLQLVRKPTVNFIYDKYCAGFPTQFTDQSNTTNSNVVTYSWIFGQGQGSSTQQNPVYTFPTASTYSVSLTVTPVACPALATSITKPVSTVAPPANQRYTSLNAVENRDLQLEARVFGGATYSWAPSSGLSSSTISNPIFNYNAQGDYVISITTGIGCVIKDTQLVRIFKAKEIYVPKGFSPNNDGNNDKISPRLVGVRALNYFKVFNRWGQMIFMSTSINEGWDGTYKGVKQPIESYVWTAEGVDIDNNIIKRTGTFLLLR